MSMKHLINPATKEIFAYAADGSQDAWIKPGLVPVSDAELVALRAAQVDPKDAIKVQIVALELQVTQRRLREAILTTAGRIWLERIDEQISILRGQL